MNRLLCALILSSFLPFPGTIKAAGVGGPGTFLGNGNDIMMECYTWTSVTPTPPTQGYWNYLASQLTTAAQAGVTLLWLPPSAASVDYRGYMPNDWYNQGNKFGTYGQLKSLLAAAKAEKMMPLADIVLQHRSGDTGALTGFERPLWTDICASFTCESLRRFSHPCATCTDGTGWSTDSMAANLNMKNQQIQTDCENYMNWMLTSMGYSAFRLDECTRFSPSYVEQFLTAAPPYFAVAEFFDSDPKDCRTYLSKSGDSCALFDFSFMYHLVAAVTNENYGSLNNAGKLNGLVGTNPANTVTMLGDHDTLPPGSLSGYSGTEFPGGKELEGYAIILTAPGTPDIFYGHYFGTIQIATSLGKPLPTPAQIAQEQSLINTLTDIRRSMGINSLSSINIRTATLGLYAAIVDNKVCVKVGPLPWRPSYDPLARSLGTWKLAAQGCCNNHYAVWVLNSAPALTPAAFPAPAPEYTNTIVRVACGRGTPYTDSEGKFWSADYGFLSGTAAEGARVTGTADPALFASARSGNPVSYNFSVPDGKYEVKLLLSETSFRSAGLRIFNIELNGITAVAGVDPFAIAGANTALCLTLTTTVSNRTLTIAAAGIQDLPTASGSINAIQVTRIGGRRRSAPTQRPTSDVSTQFPTTDTLGPNATAWAFPTAKP